MNNQDEFFIYYVLTSERFLVLLPCENYYLNIPENLIKFADLQNKIKKIWKI